MSTDTTHTDSPDISKLERIRALLSKAESTAEQYPAEAEALTAKAIELMERYRIDEVMLQDSAPLQDRGKIIETEFLIGSGPYVNARSSLLGAVAENYSVKFLAYQDFNGKTAILVGYESDVAIAEMLYTSLIVQATVALSSPEVEAERKALRVHGTRFARSFLFGFADRIRQRLSETNRKVVAEAESAGQSVALVLADRMDDVEADVFRRYGKVPTGRRPSTTVDWHSTRVGMDAADRADLSTSGRVANSATKALSA